MLQVLSTEMNVLLIADSSEQALKLRDVMEQQAITCTLRRVSATAAAAAYVRRQGPYQDKCVQDIVLFDFTEPSTDKLSLLKDLAFGASRAKPPVVVLTGDTGERYLEQDGVLDDYSTMFAPTDLDCFLTKMREHRRRRFLRALDVMYELGPILVRTPRLLMRPATAVPQQHFAKSA